jgi:sugar phosphate isomerase/epimerase
MAQAPTLHRRDFLKASASLAAAALVAPCAAGAAEAAANPQLRFGLATYQWGMDWDIPTLIANCTKAGVFGIEPRTDSRYAHGIELNISEQKRAEIRKRFADSPVKIVSLACGERMDWPEPARLKAAIEATKGYLKLSRDIGCDVLRVFPNQFHPNVPHEKTIEQIAATLNELGAAAADLGQELSLEAHGPAGTLPTIRAIMDQVTSKSVRVRLNCDNRDTQGQGFEANFNLVKHVLSRIIHLHGLKNTKYPYQLMVDLLVRNNWSGWALMENSDKVPDRVAALVEQRQIWEAMVSKALKRT